MNVSKLRLPIARDISSPSEIPRQPLIEGGPAARLFFCPTLVMRKDVRNLWNLVEPYVKDAGFDLVEVHSGREQGGWIVRLFIDRVPGPQIPGVGVSMGDDAVFADTVSLENCALVSRDVSAALDVADIIPHAYQLEVSSPGLDRPLRREMDFSRFAGRQARIRLTEGVDGRRNFSGLLRGAQQGRVEIDCDGRTYHLPIEDVAKANLVPDWDKELKRSAS
ncbi:MAG: ribosome maturation factor RimP [Pseudomonadota bacterium]